MVLWPSGSGKALQKLLQRFESARDLTRNLPVEYFIRHFFYRQTFLMSIPKWLGVIIYLGLIAICFMPWTYHPDIQKNFTGFFSEGKVYGTPGKYIAVLSLICIVLLLIDKVWIKFTHLFLGGVLLAYVIRTFQLYTSTYYATTPVKLPGIYLLLVFSVLSFIVAMFPRMSIMGKK